MNQHLRLVSDGALGSPDPVFEWSGSLDAPGADEPGSDVLIVRAVRDLDIGVEQVARTQLTGVVGHPSAPQCTIVHLGHTSFVDVRGLAVLLDAAAVAERHGRGLIIIGSPRSLRRMVDVLDLGGRLSLVDGYGDTGIVADHFGAVGPSSPPLELDPARRRRTNSASRVLRARSSTGLPRLAGHACVATSAVDRPEEPAVTSTTDKFDDIAPPPSRPPQPSNIGSTSHTAATLNGADTAPVGVATRLADDVRSALAAANAVTSAETDLRDPAQFADAVWQLLGAAVTLVPAARWASITYRGGPAQRATTLAASDPHAASADDLQYRSRQGPCLTAMDAPSPTSALPIDVPDLHADPRWPDFATEIRRAAHPARAVLSCALPLAAPHRASLNLYGAPSDPPSDSASIAAAHLTALTVGLGLTSLLHRRAADNLRLALASNRQIGAALGVLITRHHWTYDHAFGALRAVSQRTHRKLRDIADEVLLTGTLPA